MIRAMFVGLRWPCAAVVLALSLLAGVSPARAARRPNVLVIVTDDQTDGTVVPQVMPATYLRFVTQGRSYPNFTVADPLCCPSRATIMTGRYAHNTHVKTNVSLVGFDELSTIQCYLSHHGYQTGLFGKMFNSWRLTRNPICLSRWVVDKGGAHTGQAVNANGTVLTPSGYTDDFTLAHALRFLSRTERHDAQPWYMYYATSYPHSPYTPRPEHANDVLPVPTPSPAIGEDTSDKPAFVQANEGPIGVNQTELAQEQMLETADEEVATLFAQMGGLRETSNTLVIFISDNGYQFGEHQLWGKGLPYTESISVPFYMRWPGHIARGSTARRFASNVDIVPTILSATGVSPTLRSPLDGHSLFSTRKRPYAFDEFFPSKGDWRPPWASLRSSSYDYVEWYTGSGTVKEYYDLQADPYELTNLLGDGDPSNDPDVRALSALLHSARSCGGSTCP